MEVDGAEVENDPVRNSSGGVVSRTGSPSVVSQTRPGQLSMGGSLVVLPKTSLLLGHHTWSCILMPLGCHFHAFRNIKVCAWEN